MTRTLRSQPAPTGHDCSRTSARAAKKRKKKRPSRQRRTPRDRLRLRHRPAGAFPAGQPACRARRRSSTVALTRSRPPTLLPIELLTAVDDGGRAFSTVSDRARVCCATRRSSSRGRGVGVFGGDSTAIEELAGLLGGAVGARASSPSPGCSTHDQIVRPGTNILRGAVRPQSASNGATSSTSSGAPWSEEDPRDQQRSGVADLREPDDAVMATYTDRAGEYRRVGEGASAQWRSLAVLAIGSAGSSRGEPGS